MKRQVVQTLLNLPGLSGVALIDGRQRLGWAGSLLKLADQQQANLNQGIQQVVTTTPAGFDSVAFCFTDYLVYIHKLGPEQVLLLLIANPQQLNYQSPLSQLQAALLAESEVAESDVIDSLTQALAHWQGPNPCAGEVAAVSFTNEPGLATGSIAQVSSVEMIEALNHVSEGATPYLGKIIVANTWKQSRPDHPWLAQFDIQKDGHFVMVPLLAEPLTAEQQQWIRDWVAAFIERGGRTIRNFRGLVSDQVSPQDKALLFG